MLSFIVKCKKLAYLSIEMCWSAVGVVNKVGVVKENPREPFENGRLFIISTGTRLQYVGPVGLDFCTPSRGLLPVRRPFPLLLLTLPLSVVARYYVFPYPSRTNDL